MKFEIPNEYLVLAPVPAVLLGLVLLTLGRKLFWLFVGVVGFLIGRDAAVSLFPQASWVVFAGLVLGLIGVVLAILVQKIAIAGVGYFAGGYFLMRVLLETALLSPSYWWVAFSIGGLIGAILMVVVFNWTLIVFSSIGGATLIVHAFSLGESAKPALLIGLVVVGCVIQGRLLPSRSTPET